MLPVRINSNKAIINTDAKERRYFIVLVFCIFFLLEIPEVLRETLLLPDMEVRQNSAGTAILFHQICIDFACDAVGCDRAVNIGHLNNTVVVAAVAVEESVVKHLLNG